VWAASYDHEADNPVIAGEEEIIWELLGEDRNIHVLDVGCGTGRHALRLAAEGARVVGVEPTREMLSLARQKAREQGISLDLREGEIASLEPSLGEFDLVLCCLVLSHIDDLGGAISRLAGHIKPGGRLIVSDFHPFQILIGWRTSFDAGEKKYVVPNHLHLPSEYFNAMTQAGLSVTHFFEPGRFERFPGLPITLVMEAQKPAS
ncbi:unnamed protein product, partial [marine sediment metagenome]